MIKSGPVFLTLISFPGAYSWYLYQAQTKTRAIESKSIEIQPKVSSICMMEFYLLAHQTAPHTRPLESGTVSTSILACEESETSMEIEFLGDGDGNGDFVACALLWWIMLAYCVVLGRRACTDGGVNLRNTHDRMEDTTGAWAPEGEIM